MTGFKSKIFSAAALFVTAGVAFGLVAPKSAEATLMMRLTNGATTIDVTDEAVGDLAFGAPGTILFAGNVGAFTTVGSVGLAQSFSNPDSTQLNINLQSAITDGTTTETLSILLTETGLTLDEIGTAIASAGFTQANNTTMSVRAYIDDSNAAFGTGTQLFDFGPTAGTFNTDGFTTFGGIDPLFSLTLELVLTHGLSNAPVSTTGAAQVNILPEPATTAVLGLGLVAAALLRRRRKV
mgnify:CR=1 FL=1